MKFYPIFDQPRRLGAPLMRAAGAFLCAALLGAEAAAAPALTPQGLPPVAVPGQGPARYKRYAPGLFAPGQSAALLNTRVMFIGDSNTHGVQGTPSFRYPLWFKLYGHRQQLNFVGTQFTVFNENGVTLPDINQYSRYFTHFDRDHQAYNGYRTDQIVPLLTYAVDQTRPDVCLLMIGTNDIGQQGGAGVPNALSGIEDIVNTVRHQAPATTFLIANLPAIGPGSGYSGNGAHIDTFNAQLPALVSSLNKSLSRAIFIDVHSSLNLATDFMADGLHPNHAGQIKIANAIYPHIIDAMSGDFRPTVDGTVHLLDQSFEGLGLADGVYSAQPLADWDYHNEPNIATGLWNPDGVTYPGALGSGTPTGADGDEILSIENNGGNPATAWISQIMATTLEKDRTYTASVAIGHRAPGGPRGFDNFGGYEIQLLVGNSIVAQRINIVDPMPGTFVTDTLIFDASSASQSQVGNPITIRMRQTHAQVGVATDFDAVNLTIQ